MVAKDAGLLIDDAFAAYSRGDVDGFVADFAEDLHYEDTSGAPPRRGREAFKHYATGWIDASSDGRITPVWTIVRGDEVAAEVHMELTHDKGPMYGLPPSGRRVVANFVVMGRLRDGKLAVLKAFYNPASFMEQIGLIDPLPKSPT